MIKACNTLSKLNGDVNRAVTLTPSVLGCVFAFILIIWQFCTPSETHVGIETVQTLAVNLLTAIRTC